MNAMNPGVTVGQIVVDRPEAARVFESLGIDYCCGGRIPLSDACRNKGIALEKVADLLAADATRPAPAEIDWRAEPMTRLADHIEATHHEYLRRELPRLAGLIAKVVRAHGEKRPAFIALQQVFEAFSNELFEHMLKEERILFPMIRALEMDPESRRHPSHCGFIGNPIRVMEHEHDSAGVALAHMRRLCENYLPPPDACNTWRALYAGLAELESDMHQHVHKENNILFPRALKAAECQSTTTMQP